ncbi:hypothetical protein C1H46_008033 [Malus baccata]|uniref:Uncharacterized protein n=1 Tax=Malus baccata TaxID=106549 RepID=A0A540N5U7_MALBA|nr:hypothetical protein C1H46_008033 [Malus baccata]
MDMSHEFLGKLDKNDPNAAKTLSRVEAVQKLCRDSGALSKRKSYIANHEQSYNSTLVLEHCFGFSVSGPSCLYSGSPIPSRELDCVAWAKAQASLFLKRRALRKAGLTEQRSPPALVGGRTTITSCSRPFRLNHHLFIYM